METLYGIILLSNLKVVHLGLDYNYLIYCLKDTQTKQTFRISR
nr:MAG TPA: hypothetical protein [Caudoviricetes sp.]